MIIKLPLDKHILIKSQLQQHIKNGWAEPKQSNDKYYNDNISKTDWDIANNYERPWVKFFLPFFKPVMQIMNYLRYGFNHTMKILHTVGIYMAETLQVFIM